MIALNHALTGSAIALFVKRPAIAVLLAFVSHFALDALPHFGNTPIYTFGNPVFPYILALDGALTIIALVAIWHYAPHSKRWLAIICAGFAMLPDASSIWYYAYNKPDIWFFNFHIGMQWCERPWGIIIEALYAVCMGTIVATLIQKQRVHGHKSTSTKPA